MWSRTRWPAVCRAGGVRHSLRAVGGSGEAFGGAELVAVQGLGDELGHQPADELGDGAAQLVSDERLERCLGRGHGWSLRPG